jgi:hypothetical protein
MISYVAGGLKREKFADRYDSRAEGRAVVLLQVKTGRYPMA